MDGWMDGLFICNWIQNLISEGESGEGLKNKVMKMTDETFWWKMENIVKISEPRANIVLRKQLGVLVSQVSGAGCGLRVPSSGAVSLCAAENDRFDKL
jgi:hypothetical protein